MENKRFLKERGITLVALIITIIILLILAGISIQEITGSGLFEKAIQAKNMQKYSSYLEELKLKELENQTNNNNTKISVMGEQMKKYINISENDIEKFVIIEGELIYIGNDEKEITAAKALDIKVENKELEELEVLMYAIDVKNNKKEKVGMQLIDKTGNSNNWAIVTELKNSSDINKIYGTGYYYLENGIQINDKQIVNSYIVNYTNSTVINCNNGQYSYAYLDINSSLGVSENLILNLDAKNLANINDWGKGVCLYKYDDTVYPEQIAFEDTEDGYDREQVTNTSDYVKDNAFIFNGNNYIEVYNGNSFDFSEGITFEFYGNIKGNKGPINYLYNAKDKYYTGLFGMWDRNFASQPDIRFGFHTLKSLYFNFGWASPSSASLSSYSVSSRSPWNQKIDISEVWNSTEDIYLTVTLNKPEKEGENAEYYVYINGEKYIDDGWICDAYWKGFLDKTKTLNYFEIGRSSMSKPKNWSYLVGNAYTIRAYNRYLSEDEIKDNYNKTLSYHLINE